MVILILAIVFSVFNVISWLIFKAKFDKIFSTDAVLEGAKAVLNKMLADLDSASLRNIELIEDRIRQLKEVSREADQKIQLLQKELTKVDKSKVLQSKVQQSLSESSQKTAQNAVPTVRTRKNNATITAAYEKNTAQGSLFDAQEENSGSVMQIETEKNIVSKKSTSKKSKKSFAQEVKELSMLGITPEEIAAKLGRTVQEVLLNLQLS